MTTVTYWGRNIRDHSYKIAVCWLLMLLWGGMTPAAAQKASKPKSTPAAKSTATVKPTSADLALLAAAVRDRDKGLHAEAAKKLTTLQPRLPSLADHTGYLLASAQFQLKNYSEAIAALEPVWKQRLKSPYHGQAALLAARAHLENGKPEEAAALLNLHFSDLPQPEGEAVLGSTLEALGQPAKAAVLYQNIYYAYPLSPEADKASVEIARLKRELGESYPPPMPQAMLERADLLTRARQYRRALTEYRSLIRQLAGQERELAGVRVGAVQYLDYETLAAYNYLRKFETKFPETSAERLYYLTECARRLNKEGEMRSYLNRLEELYPKSPWRFKALISVGNRYLVQAQPEFYIPIYRACYESLPDALDADYCHWKVTWHAYIRRQPEAEGLLRDHLLKYPGSEKASTALYFLGRLAEKQKNLAGAKAYYTEAISRYPNHYFSMLSERRLAEPAFLGAVTSESVITFLERVVWPVRNYPTSFQPNSDTRFRMERARLLRAAGLRDMAEQELRFGVRTDEQPHILTLELARNTRNGTPYEAIRVLKTLFPGYLGVPLDTGPDQFWRLLFPLPYRASIESRAKQRKLDPYLLAGLVRQESEFNSQAVSPARAYGLTQILPSTGRALARKLRISYTTRALFRPDTNLQLGAFYLRSLVDQFDGKVEYALAAYNAGGSRVRAWDTLAKWEEPAEFIESIPFTETRNYVASVLRNQEIYRRLYTADKGTPQNVTPTAKKKASPKKATSKKSQPKKAVSKKR